MLGGCSESTSHLIVVCLRWAHPQRWATEHLVGVCVKGLKGRIEVLRVAVFIVVYFSINLKMWGGVVAGASHASCDSTPCLLCCILVGGTGVTFVSGLTFWEIHIQLSIGSGR